jgi:hypothetical protein
VAYIEDDNHRLVRAHAIESLGTLAHHNKLYVLTSNLQLNINNNYTSEEMEKQGKGFFSYCVTADDKRLIC